MTLVGCPTWPWVLATVLTIQLTRWRKNNKKKRILSTLNSIYSQDIYMLKINFRDDQGWLPSKRKGIQRSQKAPCTADCSRIKAKSRTQMTEANESWYLARKQGFSQTPVRIKDYGSCKLARGVPATVDNPKTSPALTHEAESQQMLTALKQ